METPSTYSNPQGRKQNISNWSVKHPRVGGETLDGFTKKAITAEDDGTIILNKDNFRGSLTSFLKGYTIMVNGVQGYAEGSTASNYLSRPDGELMLFILSSRNLCRCQWYSY